MKRGKVDKQGKSMVASYRYLRVSNPGFQKGGISVMFPVCKAPGPHSSISEEFLHYTILRPKILLGSWNLVNPLLRINEAWMDECAARLQPPNFRNRKILIFDRNNPIMSWGQKNIILKVSMNKKNIYIKCIKSFFSFLYRHPFISNHKQGPKKFQNLKSIFFNIFSAVV